MTAALERRLRKVEARVNPKAEWRAIHAYGDETDEEAWRLERGDEPMPPDDCLLVIRTFIVEPGSHERWPMERPPARVTEASPCEV